MVVVKVDTMEVVTVTISTTDNTGVNMVAHMVVHMVTSLHLNTVARAHSSDTGNL